MSQSVELTKAIAQAKKDVKTRRAATESTRQDSTLRGLRKALKRLQRRRRAATVEHARLNAKSAKPAAGEGAKAG